VIRWEERRELPRGVAAVLDWLAGTSPARPLSDAEWKEALAFADRYQLKLFLPDAGPAWVREEIRRDRERNRERNRRFVQLFAEVERAAAGLPIAVLKGFANRDVFPVHSDNRVQYDLDLYCPENLREVRDALLGLGYEAIEGPFTLVRRSNWKWNGDFYDPEIPIAIDLHERLWDDAMEGFAVSGLEEFWPRRVRRSVAGMRFQALAAPDALAFSALHMLRHLLHGDARPLQVYEIATLLEARAGDDAFWAEWRDMHPAELRRLEAIGFRLAEEWFGCACGAAVREEIGALSPRIGRWFERCAGSPLTAFYKPNKDELELNLCLLESPAAKARIVGRRLFPARLPRPFSHAVARGFFHLRALVPAVSMMLRMRR